MAERMSGLFNYWKQECARKEIAKKDPACEMADKVRVIVNNHELPEEVQEFAFWSMKVVGQ